MKKKKNKFLLISKFLGLGRIWIMVLDPKENCYNYNSQHVLRNNRYRVHFYLLDHSQPRRINLSCSSGHRGKDVQ